MIAVRLRVQGRVQGVCFRDWTVAAARALDLSGWVRNRRDGSVEILACGSEAAIESFVAQCRQGPPAARVDRLDREAELATGHAGFIRRPTE